MTQTRFAGVTFWIAGTCSMKAIPAGLLCLINWSGKKMDPSRSSSSVKFFKYSYAVKCKCYLHRFMLGCVRLCGDICEGCSLVGWSLCNHQRVAEFCSWKKCIFDTASTCAHFNPVRYKTQCCFLSKSQILPSPVLLSAELCGQWQLSLAGWRNMFKSLCACSSEHRATRFTHAVTPLEVSYPNSLVLLIQ